MSIIYINASGTGQSTIPFGTFKAPVSRFWEYFTDLLAKIASRRVASAADARFAAIDPRTLRDLGFEQPGMLWVLSHLDGKSGGQSVTCSHSKGKAHAMVRGET